MKTHVIYMSENEFSVKMTEDTIKSLNKFEIEYELVDGVKGVEGIDIMKTHNISPSSYVNPREWTPGTIGCLVSHYLLWDQCSKQDQPFLILEQDGVLLRDPKELLPLIENVCHLDAYLPFENIHSDSEDHSELYNTRVLQYKEGVSTHPSSNFYGTRDVTGDVFRGTYGYIITPQGAKDIIKFIKKYGAFPSDRCLCSSATYLQRANSTYVRLNPFFENLDIQRKYTLR